MNNSIYRIKHVFIGAVAVIALVSAASGAPSAQAAPVGTSALKWTTQTPAGNGAWQSVVWAPSTGKYVAVASSSSFPFALALRTMTSGDATAWTANATSTTRPVFSSITWSPDVQLFVAVACNNGVGSTCPATTAYSEIHTSPDGAVWTNRAHPVTTSTLRSITWSPALGLFVAVADSGTDRVVTSPDGITWTARTAAGASAWRNVTWSPERGLFVAVATSGADRVMTSTDGITWTARTAAEQNSWTAVTWSKEQGIFVAVSTDGTNRVMTSPDGITWTARTAAAANAWTSVAWSAELQRFIAVSTAGVDQLMTSPDGISWTSLPGASDTTWTSIVWAAEQNAFVAVGDTGTNANRVMTGAMATAATDDATAVVSHAATLNGVYNDQFPRADVFFKYRIAGSSDPYTETTPQPTTTAGVFMAGVSGLADHVTYEYKSVVRWPSENGDQALEGGLKTFVTPAGDDDNDGIVNYVENDGPNGGDANNDTVLDSSQPNVATFVNTVTNEYATLAVNGTCQINQVVSAPETANATTDDQYDYPLGMLDFELDCGTPGASPHVNMYYFNANEAVTYEARKFNSEVYATVTSAVISSASVGGANAKTVEYDIVDGGSLDADGTVNGMIADPIGLAVAVPDVVQNSEDNDTNTAISTLANTGHNAVALAAIVALSTVFGIVVWHRSAH